MCSKRKPLIKQPFSGSFQSAYTGINKFIHSEEFLKQARSKKTDFCRNRALPLPTLIPLLLNFRKGSLQDELDQFFETLAETDHKVQSLTPGALCRARQKLNPEALNALHRTLLTEIEQRIDLRRWRGLRILAVDGSTGRLPNTPDIERAYGRQADSNAPMARFSRLYDVLNGLVVMADMAPYQTSERDLAANYLSSLKPDDLVLYDRGYPAFWLFALHHQGQHHYCARVRHDFHAEVKAFVASGKKSQTLILKPGPSATKGCRDKGLSDAAILVRLIRVVLTSGEIEVLMTSLMDESTYPASAFAKLYALRWGVEELYKREKKRMEIENFSGRSARVIEQDFYAKSIAQNLAMLMVLLAQWLADARYRDRSYRYCINVANALSKMKNTLVRLLLNPSPWALCWSLLERMVASVEPVRPERSYPRTMKTARTPGFYGNYKRCR